MMDRVRFEGSSAGWVMIVDGEPVATIERKWDRARGPGWSFTSGPLRDRWFSSRPAAVEAHFASVGERRRLRPV